MKKTEATPGNINTLALWLAGQKAKAAFRARGLKPAYMEQRVLRAAASYG